MKDKVTLTKAELADLMFEKVGLNKREAKDMVESFFEEIRIARTTTGGPLPSLGHLMAPEDVIRHQDLVRRVPVPDHIYAHAARLARRTRPSDPSAPAWLRPLVAWGADE